MSKFDFGNLRKLCVYECKCVLRIDFRKLNLTYLYIDGAEKHQQQTYVL